MQIEFTNAEIVFIYGTAKKELLSMKSQKSIRYSKSDLKLYENLLTKLEKAYPALVNIPI